MFSSKVTDWTSQKENIQLEIELFFKSHSLIQSASDSNPFNGFLIDFEFLFLKKNYSLKIKEHSSKSGASKFFGGYFGGSTRKVKTKDMKGMISSTVFTLNQSQSSGSEVESLSRSRAHSKFNLSREPPLTDEERIPFLLDFIVKYSKGYSPPRTNP